MAGLPRRHGAWWSGHAGQNRTPPPARLRPPAQLRDLSQSALVPLPGASLRHTAASSAGEPSQRTADKPPPELNRKGWRPSSLCRSPGPTRGAAAAGCRHPDRSPARAPHRPTGQQGFASCRFALDHRQRRPPASRQSTDVVIGHIGEPDPNRLGQPVHLDETDTRQVRRNLIGSSAAIPSTGA